MSLTNRPITAHPVHIIYRLIGSLPRHVLEELRDEYTLRTGAIKLQLQKVKSKNDPLYWELRQHLDAIQQELQEKYDRYLDQVLCGPRYLDEPELARIIIDSWRDLEKMHGLVVDAISVMPNHVHVLLATAPNAPVVDSKALMESHRKWTGRRINQHRGTVGDRVWATPFFDRDTRWNTHEKVFWYVLNNPVKAHLCQDFSK